MKTARVVKYAGFSRVVNEKGEVSHNFHTSNNTKYAVWAKLPEGELGQGYQVTFQWYKLPVNTDKLTAVRTLLGFENVKKDTALVAVLQDVIDRATPKAKAPKAPKATKAPKAPKAAKVSVTTKSPAKAKTGGSAESLAKIKEMAQNFAAKRAGKAAA